MPRIEGGNEAVEYLRDHDPMAAEPLPDEAWPDWDRERGLIMAGIFYNTDEDDD